MRSEHSTVSENVEWRPRLKVPTVARFLQLREAFKGFLLCQQAKLQKHHGVVEHEVKRKLHWKNLGVILLKVQVRLKIIRRRVYKENLDICALPCLELESPGGVDLGNILNPGFKHNSGTCRGPNISMF